jgi:hypothetical protein
MEMLMSLKMVGNNHRRFREEQGNLESRKTGDEDRDHGAFKQEEECGTEHPDAGASKRKRDPLAPTPKTTA